MLAIFYSILDHDVDFTLDIQMQASHALSTYAPFASPNPPL
jgi:hypothetical protein